MPILHKTLFTFCGLFIFFQSKSQDFFSQIDTSAIRYYTRADGLPSIFINDIVQDERGFLWIATPEGLSRFDGKNFQNFFHNPEKNSLPSDIINDLEMLGNNKLALATGSGVCLMNVLSQEVKTFQFTDDQLYFSSHNFFNFVTVDHKGRLWAGSNTGLFLLNEKLEIISHWRDSINAETFKTKSIKVAAYDTWVNGHLLFYYKEKFHYYDEEKKELKIFKPLDTLPGYMIVEGLPFSRSPELTMAKKDTLVFLNVESGLLEKRTLRLDSNNYYSHSFHLNDSSVLLGTGLNLTRFYNRINGKYFDLKLRGSYDVFKPNYIFNAFVDRDKNLWIATPFYLVKIPVGKKVINSFKAAYFPGNTNPLLPVNAFLIRDSVWWVGTYESGLFRINPLDKTSKHFDLRIHDSVRLSNWIWHIRSHSNDTLWLSTQAGLLWFHEKNHTSGRVKYRGMPEIFNGYPIVCTQFEDSKGIIWMGIGAGNGLVTFNRHTGEWYHYNTKKPGCPLPLRHITAIDEDENGDLWMGTQRGGGLIKWTRKANSFSLIGVKPDSDFRQDNIDFIYSDQLGNIWIGVGSYGIVKHDIRSGSFRLFNRSSGLCSNKASSCVLIGDYLWISTNEGISCLNTLNESVVNFTSAEGLSGNNIETLYFDKESGNLFSGGTASFDVFNPDELLEREKQQPVFITSINVFDTRQPLNSNKTIELKHNENFLRFDFSEINFAGNISARFEYMMEGLDNKWNKGGSEGFASYSGMPPGEYIFRVKKEGSGDTASSDFYRIIIHPPFWQTWWFRLPVIFSIAGLIYLVVARRVQVIRKEEKQKTAINRQLAEVEMKALRAQMNPHFIFNSLNSIHRFILSNDTEKASHYLTTFSKLIRLILENSDKKTVPLENEIELLNTYLVLEENRFKTKFEYSIHVDDSIDKQKTEIPSMLIQPYIENAIWHGLLHKETKGEVEVSFSKNKNGIECVIEDNGIGREKAMLLKKQSVVKQQSMGMKVSKERLTLLGKLYHDKPEINIIDLKNEMGEAIGTKVQIHIPVEE